MKIMSLKDLAPFSWPAVILVVVISFYGPLYRTIDSLSRSLEDVSHIRIGDLEITVDPDKLPRPEPQVVSALSGISQEGLLLMLELMPPADDSSSSGGYCFYDMETDPRMTRYRELETAGLVTIEVQEETDQWCPNPHSVELTSVGVAVKNFSISLLVAQITQ